MLFGLVKVDASESPQASIPLKTVNWFEFTEVSPDELAVRAYKPAASNFNDENVATPLTALTDPPPVSVPVPGPALVSVMPPVNQVWVVVPSVTPTWIGPPPLLVITVLI